MVSKFYNLERLEKFEDKGLLLASRWDQQEEEEADKVWIIKYFKFTTWYLIFLHVHIQKHLVNKDPFKRL